MEVNHSQSSSPRPQLPVVFSLGLFADMDFVLIIILPAITFED